MFCIVFALFLGRINFIIMTGPDGQTHTKYDLLLYPNH